MIQVLAEFTLYSNSQPAKLLETISRVKVGNFNPENRNLSLIFSYFAFVELNAPISISLTQQGSQEKSLLGFKELCLQWEW